MRPRSLFQLDIARDQNLGVLVSLDAAKDKGFNHNVIVDGGILAISRPFVNAVNARRYSSSLTSTMQFRTFSL